MPYGLAWMGMAGKVHAGRYDMGFVCTAVACAVQLVTATVQLYNAIRTELLPTPNKSHYTFNLRDMGKVVQGLMRADPKTLSTQEQVWCALLQLIPEPLRDTWHVQVCSQQPSWTRLQAPCCPTFTDACWLQVLSLWLHETSRVFADRLTCQEDHSWFRWATQHRIGMQNSLARAGTLSSCK